MQRPTVIVICAPGTPAPREFDVLAEEADIIAVNDSATLRAAQDRAEIAVVWNFRSELIRAVGPGHLKWIHSNSVGLDCVLTPEVVAAAVVVTNTRGVYEPPIAEWVLAAILYFVKDMRATVEFQQRATWRHRETSTLRGRRAVVLGPGAVGREIVALLRAVGMTVEVVGRHPRRDDQLGDIHGIGSLDTLLPHADDVVVALPLTSNTRHVIDSQRLAHMQPGGRLINVGRGALVDTDALLESLRTGHLSGAALDVFEQEPLPSDHPLWSMSNVLVSPHMSGDTIGMQQRSVELFRQNLQRWKSGAPLHDIVDKEALASGELAA